MSFSGQLHREPGSSFYALIGVNVASRIQDLTKQFRWDILISKETAAPPERGLSTQERGAGHGEGVQQACHGLAGHRVIRMEEFVKVAVLENDIEAQFVASVLEERSIPHVMQSYHDTAYDGLFQTQRGWGQVNAPASYRETILEIIMEARGKGEEDTTEQP